jgi:hypothetical protein
LHQMRKNLSPDPLFPFFPEKSAKMSGQYRREFFIRPEELISSPGSVWDGESLHPDFLSGFSRIKEFWILLQLPDRAGDQ